MSSFTVRSVQKPTWSNRNMAEFPIFMGQVDTTIASCSTTGTWKQHGFRFLFFLSIKSFNSNKTWNPRADSNVPYQPHTAARLIIFPRTKYDWYRTLQVECVLFLSNCGLFYFNHNLKSPMITSAVVTPLVEWKSGVGCRRGHLRVTYLMWGALCGEQQERTATSHSLFEPFGQFLVRQRCCDLNRGWNPGAALAQCIMKFVKIMQQQT